MEFNLSTTWAVILIILVIWEWVWKGTALWRAGRNNQLGWFIAILLINSVGILPIIYLLSHKNSGEEDYRSEKAIPIKG